MFVFALSISYRELFVFSPTSAEESMSFRTFLVAISMSTVEACAAVSTAWGNAVCSVR